MTQVLVVNKRHDNRAGKTGDNVLPFGAFATMVTGQPRQDGLGFRGAHARFKLGRRAALAQFKRRLNSSGAGSVQAAG